RCERWLRHLTLFLYLGTEGVLDPWLPEVNTGQLHIVPLTTPFAILDEATSMQNCIADYGALIAAGAYRLFS
ncbi:hypothetical protein, partial [Stenotrophomonas maltophilia]|uniref:hypothetical protein n=1 Tax=Stenotrophomonas maltophilia TaxID=40324 RepID=UPI0013DAA72E